MNENIIIATSKIAQYGGAGSALVFGLSLEQLAALVGVAVAILGFLTNLYFQWRKDTREERFLEKYGRLGKTEPDSDKAPL